MQTELTPRIAMVAGEASGDLLASMLLDGMQARWTGMQAAGIGGPRMAQRGFACWWPHDTLAVRGYAEVLRHFPEILRIRRQLTRRLLADRPDVFIGVDAPDFNLGLEEKLRSRGMHTVHFVCPSIWAWRPQRVHQVRASAEHVLCVFPFEPALLAQHGIESTFVGHPLANAIPMEPDKMAARATLGLAPEDIVVALLPGSRGAEVHYLAERFFKAAAWIRKDLPHCRFVVPCIAALRERIARTAAQSGLAGDALMLLDGQSHTVLAACDVTLIASGTATLEATLFKRPMVIAYNMNPITYGIMLTMERMQPWFGMPNILAREFLVPEFLQGAATPQALADAVLQWLHSPEKVAALQQRFAAMHHDLQRDTATLATDAVAKVLQK